MPFSDMAVLIGEVDIDDPLVGGMDELWLPPIKRETKHLWYDRLKLVGMNCTFEEAVISCLRLLQLIVIVMVALW